MNFNDKPKDFVATRPADEQGDFFSSIDFGQVYEALVRQARVMAVILAAVIGLGFVYIVTAVPQYTSTVTILIDSRRNQDQLSGSIAELNIDTGAIDSQLEVIRRGVFCDPLGFRHTGLVYV